MKYVGYTLAGIVAVLTVAVLALNNSANSVSYTHLTLPTMS